MATLEELLDEYENACRAEERALNEGHLSPAIISRRNSATRSLHAAEDPWMPCVCLICQSSDH